MYVKQHNSLVSDNQSLITVSYWTFMLSWINEEDPRIIFQLPEQAIMRFTKYQRLHMFNWSVRLAEMTP